MQKDVIIIKKLMLLVENNLKKIEETDWDINLGLEKDKSIFETRLLINRVIKKIDELSNSDNKIKESLMSKIHLLNQQLVFYEKDCKIKLTNKKHR